MSDLEQAVELAGAAERDISALRGMGDATVFADEIFGFHVQQAAEKLFRAWLASQGETYPLSHDLAALSDMLSTGGADVARFNGLVDYTRYAVRLRYAGAQGD
ncbi:MAG: HEPN domain-containing protein [bacterium]|nr:HEPN domain-containing protein [bacterium]